MKTIARLALCACLLVSLLGCEMLAPNDRQMVRSFIEDWVRSRQMHPMNEDGSLNLAGLWSLGTRAVTGSSGDEEADAVLDAYEVVSNIYEADKLMEQGRLNGDAAAMDQAITRRPGDWTYRVSRATLALEQGDVSTFEEQQRSAENILQQNENISLLWYHNQHIAEYGQLEEKLAPSGFQSAEQCRQLYATLANHYASRYEITANELDQIHMLDYLSKAETCR